jgi:hypothetical protein
MGAVQERISEIARRCGDLTPLKVPVRKVFVDGNRARALAGTDVNGQRFKELKPATLRNRPGDGPPQAPRRAESRIVTEYHVDVQAGLGRLTFAASWPEIWHWLTYHVTGTRYMKRRDPTGFRAADLDRTRGMLREHVMGGNGRGQ